jgi:predicted metalloprotease with PDZ domain
LTATRDPNPLFTGNGGGLQFNFVNITAQSYPNNQLITLSTYFTEILNEIAMSFGKLKTEKYTVVFNNILGGLEGTYGFSINHEPDLSPKSKYNYTLVHEVLHDVIGIHCGDYDDPWWKEAAATYHGATIATRIGLLDIDTLRAMLTKRVWFADSIKFNYALSDQWLRGNMFPQDIFPIAYDKGSQVLMLLDLRIRLASENKYSLDDVTNYLINHFYNAAFSRNDFLNTIRLLGNANVEDIFSTFIDKAGVTFADSTLEQTFNQLQILGAFGQSNNVNKKMW